MKQQCIDAIALSVSERKLESCQLQLQQLTPTIAALREQIKEQDRILAHNQLVRAVTALVLTPGRKQLAQVLHRWQRNAQVKSASFQKTTRRLLLKVYNSKLAQAFNRLKITEAFKQKQ